MFFKNALQAVWLEYTTKYIVKQDLNLIENYDDDDDEENTSLRKKNSIVTSRNI